MLGEEDCQGDQTYGPWPWIFGLMAGIMIVVLMYVLATGFS